MAEHGTYARSVSGCELQCTPCKKAKRDYSRRRARLIAYGQWAPWVDADPVRIHVKELQALGLGTPRISRAAGLAQSVLNRLLYGEPHLNRPPTRSMRPEIAQRILAVSATSGPLAGVVRVDATGTRRRLQALIYLGWTMEQLGADIGASATAVYRSLRNPKVSADRAASVAELYDRLWDQRPRAATPHERTTASKARNMAAARGWAPPMAWDDDTIDDPNAKPEGAGMAFRGKLPHPDEVAWLHYELGETVQALAMRFDVEVDSVRQALGRAGKAAA